MRRVNVFKYHGKEFRCGDMSVESYWRILERDESVYEDMLMEYNDELPILNKRQFKLWVDYLIRMEDENIEEEFKKALWWANKSSKKVVEDSDDSIGHDFHILVGRVMHYLNQSNESIMKMSLWEFNLYSEDIGVIIGREEYDKKRKSEKPNKSWFKKKFGNLYN